MAENKKLLMYKGKPLVRKDNTLYYGYMDEPCIIMMQITSTKDVNGAELSDKILVQLVSTNEDLRPRDRILKKAERRGLYSAIDIGSIWLERELQKRADRKAEHGFRAPLFALAKTSMRIGKVAEKQ